MLGIVLISLAFIIAVIYGKIILIWRDVMLMQNNMRFEDAEKLRKLRSEYKQPKGKHKNRYR